MTTGPKKPNDLAARALEESFFLEQDKVLIEKLRAMKRMSETKEALSRVSGIENDAILARLVQLDVKPEIVAALAAVPLVEVAWADGRIDEEERKAVLAHADARGIRTGTMERELLERWLTHRPEPRLLDAWRTYVEGLCEGLGAAERAQLRDELLHATRTTAQASGGFLGMGSKTSAAEQRVLDQLAASFG
jgi:hypothetical protein